MLRDGNKFSLVTADSRRHSQLFRHSAASFSGEAVKLKYRLAQPALHISACALHFDQPGHGATSAASLSKIIFGK
jgi:hypothetical protein